MAEKGDKVSSNLFTVFFFLREREREPDQSCELRVCVFDSFHTRKDFQRVDKTTLELYMHQSADQILVVLVLMFVTCVLIIKHNVIY